MAWYNPKTWGKKEPTPPPTPLVDNRQSKKPEGDVYISRRTNVTIGSGGKITYGGDPAIRSSTQQQIEKVQQGYDPATKTTQYQQSEQKQPLNLNYVQQKTNVGVPITDSTGRTIYQEPKYINPYINPRGTRTDISSKYTYGAGEKPTIKDVKPKGFLGTIGETWKTGWGMTPVGIIGESVSSTIKREKGIPLWSSWGESKESVRQRKLDKLTAEWQEKKVEEFNLNVNVADYTDEQKYNTYQQGKLKLWGAGIRTEEKVDIETGTTKLYYSSPEWDKTTGFEYLYKKGIPVQKVFLVGAVGSSSALKMQVELGLIKATKIPASLGRGYAYTSAVIPKTASVVKWGAIGGLGGAIGYGKYKEYGSTEFKPEFWTKTGGEVAGFTLFTMAETGNLGYDVITQNSAGKTEYGAYQAFGKPIVTKTPTGWTLGYPKTFNIGASTADLSVRGFNRIQKLV